MNFQDYFNKEDDSEFWTEGLSDSEAAALRSEHKAFCTLLKESNYLSESVRVDEGLRDKVAFVKKLAKTLGTGIKKLSKIFLNKVVYQFFSMVGWSLRKLFEIVKKGFDLYEDLQRAIAKYIHESKVGEWTERELRKLHIFLERNHPFFKRAAGVAVAGMLIFIWLNMTFTGHPFYDFDLSDMVAALAGDFVLYEIFAGEDGIRLLMLFATGFLLGLSFPWPGPQHIQFVSAVTYGAAKYVGVQFDIGPFAQQNENLILLRKNSI